MAERTIIEISPRSLFWALGIVLGLFAVYLVGDILAILLFAIIVSSAIEPVLSWLEKKSIPRILSLIFIYLLLFVLFAAVIYILLPILLEQLDAFLSRYQSYLERLLGAASDSISFVPEISGGTQSLLKQLTEQIPSFVSLISYASSIFGGIIGFFTVFVVSFYLSLSRGALDDFLRSIMPAKYEVYVLDLWQRAQKKMGRWLQGQVLLSLMIGMIIWFGLWLLGVPYAFLVAIIAAIFEIVPFVGPIVTGSVAVLLALTQSTALALVVLVFFIIVQQLENHVVVPIFTKKLIGLNPVAVILALLVGAKLAGILGILLAVPLTAVIDEFFDDIAKRKASTLI